MFPHYEYPAGFISGLVRDSLLERSRNFAADARECAARLRPPLRVQGDQHIPPGGCYAITLNHYYRKGFTSQWSALAISSVIPVNVHWIMTGELTFPGFPLAAIGNLLSRFVLQRLAMVYGFTSMPPMPPRLREVEARAAAVRSVLRHARQTPNAVIALAPEGGDQPGGRIRMPPAGVGRFCLLLAEAGMRFLPAGLYEKDGQLCLTFGEPYELRVSEGLPRHRKDALAARLVMRRIAALLPERLRGEFGNQAC